MTLSCVGHVGRIDGCLRGCCLGSCEGRGRGMGPAMSGEESTGVGVQKEHYLCCQDSLWTNATVNCVRKFIEGSLT